VKLIVGVADMKVSSQSEDLLVTHGLGSCLGIVAYDPVAKVGGMLHVMMPTASANPEKAKANPWMFVDSGMPAFFKAMEAAGAVKNRCRMKVAGGAAVMQNDYFAIGKKNYISLKKVLWQHGVLINAEDVGGNVARTMYMAIETGRVWLTTAGQEREL
jgi:chemotaxis protein CheD